jgi:hypothetical protein
MKFEQQISENDLRRRKEEGRWGKQHTEKHCQIELQ